MAHFPLIKVNAALFFSLVPISFIFRFESLTNKVELRWNTNITLFTGWGSNKTIFDSDTVDYRAMIRKNVFNQATFGVWTFQVLVTLAVVVYHLCAPHHPKHYSTKKNTVSIIAHMIGGTSAILGFYIGALTNYKPVCMVAAVFGLLLHWPSTIWQVRQLHGQRELMIPCYIFLVWLLLQGYIEMFLYGGSYQSLFSCAMTMNTFAMVRLYDFLGSQGGMEASLDRSTVLAGLCNIPFVLGVFGAFITPLAIFLWNIYFEIFKPMPRSVMRIARGYNDTVSEALEEKRGFKFAEELAREAKNTKCKKEAIARALFKVLAGDDKVMDVQEVIDLYESWGMPDAEAAAYSTFRKTGTIDYEEFKECFKEVIRGIYIKGEYEVGQDESSMYASRGVLSRYARVSQSP